MAKEIDLLNILSNGEKNLLDINDYLAISLIPLSIDNIESDVLNELKNIKNILKSPSSIVEQDVMDNLKNYMEKLKIQYPLQSNSSPMQIYFVDEPTEQKCMKSLSLAFHFIHIKKNKYKLDTTIEQKISNNLGNLNDEFKSPVPSFKKNTYATGCYYRKSDKKNISFVNSCIYTIENRIQSNNDAHYQEDKKNLHSMICYAILGKLENKRYEELYQIINDYGQIFKNDLLDRIDNVTPDERKEIEEFPSFAFVDKLKEMFNTINYTEPTKTGVGCDPIIKFNNILFMQDVSDGIVKLKTHNGTAGFNKAILKNMLETYNDLLKKLNKPTINDNDIKKIVNDQVNKFKSNLNLKNKMK